METAQPLHPESKVVVDLVVKARAKAYLEQTVEEARASSRLFNTSEFVAGKVQYDGSRKELFIPQPDFTGIYYGVLQMVDNRL